MKLASIVIPTLNNTSYLYPMIKSLYNATVQVCLLEIIIVNNGHKDSVNPALLPKDVKIIHTGENLGWEGGLNEGLKHVTTPIVIFSNDDVQFLPASSMWLMHMLSMFRDSQIAAVGPSSNVVMGVQNIFHSIGYRIVETKYLVGFLMAVRKKSLEEVGGIDVNAPSGDDIDLSIRLRNAGYKLACLRMQFVYHHGFKTGERLRGGANVANGWNSPQMTEKTNLYLIRKHGLYAWYDTILRWNDYKNYETILEKEDKEQETIEDLVEGEKVVELGCGSKKTVPYAIGVDITPNGQPLENFHCGSGASAADITADVSKPLPKECLNADCIIARHILEHMLDFVKALENWRNALKPGGTLILALPDESKMNTIPLNPQHLHAFTIGSLDGIMRYMGFEAGQYFNDFNGISFIRVYKKRKVSEEIYDAKNMQLLS